MQKVKHYNDYKIKRDDEESTHFAAAKRDAVG
jgi:hypothetical protein